MSWTEVAAACAASFVLTVVFTRLLIPFLKSRQLGKTIREDGPAHQAKAGTPTMGGLGMLAAVGISIVLAAVASLLWSKDALRGDTGVGSGLGLLYMLPTFVLMMAAWLVLMMGAYAVVGFLDDWQGLARKGRAREIGVGMTARQMIVAQCGLAVLLTLALAWITPEFGMADIGVRPPWLALSISAVAIVGTVNGVNLSDGLDGLAAGLLATAFAAIGVVMFLLLNQATAPIELSRELSGDQVMAANRLGVLMLVAFSASASCLGFLVFNRHPAQVFMGNVASMGLGALLAALAIVGGVWYLLPVIGAVFVVEVVSDIIQIVYFKRTGGKRFFLMAPLHHHFEKLGWPETKVVTVFWSCGLVAAIAGVGLAALLARS